MSGFFYIMRHILIKRSKGGLGDIFMHRMLFEDFKLLYPDIHVSFACPEMYKDAVIDHPFIDEIIDCKSIDRFRPDVVDTSNICNRYELRMSPYGDKHRSDIWAEHCGIELTRHSMHFHVSQEETDWAKNKLKTISDGRPTLALSPISAMQGKNLDVPTINELVNRLSKYNVFVLHNRKIEAINCEQITDCSIRTFISLLNEVDCVVSVDSAAFHCAGGLGKPLTGIFSFVDGKI